jgi:hypothetical protein
MEFWARMERRGQAGPPQILSTHPSNHNRQEKIREWLPKAHERAERAECGMTSHYGRLFPFLFDSFRRSVMEGGGGGGRCINGTVLME